MHPTLPLRHPENLRNPSDSGLLGNDEGVPVGVRTLPRSRPANAMPGELGARRESASPAICKGFGEPPPVLVLTGRRSPRSARFLSAAEEARTPRREGCAGASREQSLRGETLDRMRALGVNAVSISLDGAVALDPRNDPPSSWPLQADAERSRRPCTSRIHGAGQYHRHAQKRR